MIDNTEAAEAAHNALSETDQEYGRLQGYVAMAPHYAKIIKAKHLLKAQGTVAEKESVAYSSVEYIEYMDKLNEAVVEFNVLDDKRASWNREVDIWRTLSANQRR